MVKLWVNGSVAMMLALGALTPLHVCAEEDVPLVDGHLWLNSSVVEKKSYLIGASNVMSIEHAYQERSGNPPTDEQTTIGRFWNGSENLTLDAAIQGLDEWYENNPNGMDKAVLDVIWIKWVDPNTEGGS